MEVSVALREIADEEVLEELLSQRVEVCRVTDLARDNLRPSAGSSMTAYLLVQLHGVAILGEERRVASLMSARRSLERTARQTYQHLKDQNAKCVPVDALVVTLGLHDFRGHWAGQYMPAE
jgi:hypothetical protein